MDTDKNTTISIPEWVEQITEGGEVAYVRSSLATLEDIEKDIIRTLADLRFMVADPATSTDTKARVFGLYRLRIHRIGSDDNWLTRLSDAILQEGNAAK